MEGRELIIYILEHGLENESIFSEEFLKFMPSIESVAIEFNVGVATVEVWVQNNCLQAFEINDKTYITPSSLNTFKERIGRREVENV